MIPVRDSIEAKRWPLVTVLLIIINVAIFFAVTGLNSRQTYELYRAFGMTPIYFQNLSAHSWHGSFPVHYTLITSQFLHGSWGHLFGNMLYLWVFGDNVEDRLGRLGFLFIYLLAGAVGNYFQLFSDPYSNITVVGASGAIAGVLGAYFFMFPKAKVRTIIPYFLFFFFPINLPAVIYLGGWFLMQVLYSRSMLVAGSQNVAYLAHVGGLILGALVGWLERRRHKNDPEILDIVDDDYFDR